MRDGQARRVSSSRNPRVDARDKSLVVRAVVRMPGGIGWTAYAAHGERVFGGAKAGARCAGR